MGLHAKTRRIIDEALAILAERDPMNAREIALALGGHWHGSYGMAQCPAHDDGRTPALKISDDDRKLDGVDVVCFAGCDWRDVKAALRERGLLPETIPSTSTTSRRRRRGRHRPAPHPETVGADDDNTKLALQIWREAQPAAGTKVKTYLQGRGITLTPPASLRYHRALKYARFGLVFPAMVVAVQGPHGRITAIHRTFLLPDGSTKAQVSSPKMALGPLGNGAVRLARAGACLGLAEGVETALSVMQLFDLPCWAALGSRLDKVDLPEFVRHVVIFADNGQAGREAANKAAETFTSQGRRVTLRLPPEGFGDWNDALVALQAERAP